MNIYLVRHGQSEGNSAGIYCGVTDVPLTKNGTEQTQRAINYLKTKKADTIYSSPLSRARAIADKIGKRPVCDKRICERNFGIWEGLSYNLICDMYPDEAECWKRDWINYRIPKGESCSDVDIRCRDFLGDCISRGKDCIVVTHSGIIRNIITVLLNMSIEDVWRFKIDNGSVTHIEIKDGYAVICNLNYIP